MSRFEQLLAIIRSGQMSERQIAAEMRDPVFSAYWRQRAEAGRDRYILGVLKEK